MGGSAVAVVRRPRLDSQGDMTSARSGSASTPAARSPTSSPSTRRPASWSPPRRRPPRRPGRRLHGRHRQGARAAGAGAATDAGSASPRSATAPPSPPTSCSRARSEARLHHHRGLRVDARDRPADRAGRLRQLLLLGEARPRSSRADRVKTVGGRLDVTGPRDPAVRRGAAPATVARWFRDQGINTLGVCFLHSYADPTHEERMRDVLAEEHPDAVVSISSEVLREYREYERSRDHPRRRRGEADSSRATSATSGRGSTPSSTSTAAACRST